MTCRDNSSDSQYSDEASLHSSEQERRRNNRNKHNPFQDIQYLQGVRIIQRNLVYVIGLAPHLADENLLRSPKLFGQYGCIKKIILNSSPQLIEKVHSCCAYSFIFVFLSRYITYSTSQEALLCIQAVDGCCLQGSQIRASFGTTKYCNYFLRGIRCTNTDCMYLHHMADTCDCFTKKEMQTRQTEFYAKTHPGTNDNPSGVAVDVLPPIRNHLSVASERAEKLEGTPMTLHRGMPMVFGEYRTDYSVLLSRDFCDQKPFQCCNVPSDDEGCVETLAEMIAEDNIHCISSSSSNSLDLDFLLKADEFIHKMRKQYEKTGDGFIDLGFSCVVWNWRSTQRSNSIDSNTSVDI